MSDIEKIEKQVEAFLKADYANCDVPHDNFNAYAVGYLTRAVAMAICDPDGSTAFWADKLLPVHQLAND